MNDTIIKIYKYLAFNSEKIPIILTIVISLMIIIITIYLTRKELKND